MGHLSPVPERLQAGIQAEVQWLVMWTRVSLVSSAAMHAYARPKMSAQHVVIGANSKRLPDLAPYTTRLGSTNIKEWGIANTRCQQALQRSVSLYNAMEFHQVWKHK